MRTVISEHFLPRFVWVLFMLPALCLTAQAADSIRTLGIEAKATAADQDGPYLFKAPREDFVDIQKMFIVRGKL